MRYLIIYNKNISFVQELRKNKKNNNNVAYIKFLIYEKRTIEADKYHAFSYRIFY